VRSDVISDSVKNYFADAIREQNLRIAGNPRIEPKAEAAAPDQLEFSATFEIYPEVKVGDLSASRSSARRRRSARTTSSGPSRCCVASAHATSGLRAPRRTGDRASSTSRERPEGSNFPAGKRPISPIILGEGRMLPSSRPAVAG
jgi:trigger factor